MSTAQAKAANERLTSCEDVRRQRQGEEGRDPWCEVPFKDSAVTLGLRQLVTDAITSDWRQGRVVRAGAVQDRPGRLLAVPTSRSVGRIKISLDRFQTT